MTGGTGTLIADYFDTGTLPGLPGHNLIGGEQVAAEDGATMEVFDPGLAQPFHSVPASGESDVIRAVEVAAAALTGVWADMMPAERGRVLMRAAALIREQQDMLSVIEALDTGKPLAEAQGDVGGAARCFEYYAGLPDKLEGRSFPLGRRHVGYSSWEPVGVTAHIVPWNYPISTLARSLAPALAAGCSAVVKPAEQTPMTAIVLGSLLLEAGLPAGVVNILSGTGTATGAPLVAHRDVRHVTFTGSTTTGIKVMRAAARNVTSVLPELGGKSPVVVLADADVARTVENVLGAIYENAGQICSAGSRLVVERPLHDELVGKLVARARAIRLGHGLRGAQMGPINSLAHLERIARMVDAARDRGVEVLCGGQRAVDPETGKGWFYEPTILAGADEGDDVVQQEIFGPVLTVQVADDADHALALANGTEYALVAGVFTRDFAAAHRLAGRIDAGQVFINEYFAGGIEVPFGGNRMSGFGREKGLDALRSYTKLKSVAAYAGRD